MKKKNEWMNEWMKHFILLSSLTLKLEEMKNSLLYAKCLIIYFGI